MVAVYCLHHVGKEPVLKKGIIHFLFPNSTRMEGKNCEIEPNYVENVSNQDKQLSQMFKLKPKFIQKLHCKSNLSFPLLYIYFFGSETRMP